MNSGLQSRAPKDPWTRVIVVSEDCPADIIFSHRSWRPTDFNIMKTLFVGKRSVIYRAVVHGTAVPLVLKVYVKNRLAAVHRKQVEREIQIHSAISHENIIKMYGAFEDTDHVYLLLESAGKGDLLDDMNKRETFYPKPVIARFMAQMLDALTYLHSKGIMHRDLKPENIVLVDDDYSIKLIDFGLSIDYTHERPVSAVGTLQYMAPEVVICPTKSRPEENKDNPLLQYGTGSDIWAVGVIAYELLTGRAPFDTGRHSKEEETEQRIMYMEPKFPADMDHDAADFVRRCISKVPRRRPAAGDLLHHRWIAQHERAWRSSFSLDDVDAPAAPARTSGSPGSSCRNSCDELLGSALRPQMSVISAKDAANDVGLTPLAERSATANVGAIERQWLYSKDRLQRPVPQDLQVTGTTDREEAVGREEVSRRSVELRDRRPNPDPPDRAPPASRLKPQAAAKPSGERRARILAQEPGLAACVSTPQLSAPRGWQSTGFSQDYSTQPNGTGVGASLSSSRRHKTHPFETMPSHFRTCLRQPQGGSLVRTARRQPPRPSAAPGDAASHRSSDKQQPRLSARKWPASSAAVEAALRQSLLLAESSAPALRAEAFRQRQPDAEPSARSSGLALSRSALLAGAAKPTPRHGHAPTPGRTPGIREDTARRPPSSRLVHAQNLGARAEGSSVRPQTQGVAPSFARWNPKAAGGDGGDSPSRRRGSAELPRHDTAFKVHSSRSSMEM